MDTGNKILLLKGELKTQKVESIERKDSTAWYVRFHNSSKLFVYSNQNVCWLSPAKYLVPELCKVFRNGVLQKGISEICQYCSDNEIFWRVKFESGDVREYDSLHLQVSINCLDSKQSMDVFSYMRDIAATNPLGKSEEEAGVLSAIYQRLDFIDDSSAAACYVSPDKRHIKQLKMPGLIFPFGSNASQKQAVANAFSRQISIIQGPPGTGKTQTILNIIANLLLQEKSVMVVSNNNSATGNVLEKLQKNGMGFIVAPLGSRTNKEAFIVNQPRVPERLSTYHLSSGEERQLSTDIKHASEALDKVFALQNRLAQLRLELSAMELEWQHFCREKSIADATDDFRHIRSSRILSLWLKLQAEAERGESYNGLIGYIKLWWMRFLYKYRWKFRNRLDSDNLWPLIIELQELFYLNRLQELHDEIESSESALRAYDSVSLTKELTDKSLRWLRSALSKHYVAPRTVYSDVREMRGAGRKFLNDYPVVLSTTFSARTCLMGDEMYDYIIMDEASQISVDTGLLALSCARNAVIVGDTLQLPNVVKDDVRLKLDAIISQYRIPKGYDAANMSLLQSVTDIIPDAPQILLREHYRCHPRIINFCNQRFYGGSLLIMTSDKGEPDVLSAIRTVPGNHAVDHFNQREIDVVKAEVLPTLKDSGSIGIVTPYNRQVDKFREQLPTVEAATVHKFQGREKDAIIMSVVDNQITDFADNPYLLNVAVSRAKNRFVLVVSGNAQEQKGNIQSLLDYIAYNNFSITDSGIRSIFDNLYAQYTGQRIAMLDKSDNISEYDSERLTYRMLRSLIVSNRAFSYLRILCHTPLRSVVGDFIPLTEEERAYAGHPGTHLDFLLVDRVSHKPVMAIETDGYSYHNEDTRQHHRDRLKDRILAKYGLPLLRLSTKGSGEEVRVTEKLSEILRL